MCEGVELIKWITFQSMKTDNVNRKKKINLPSIVKKSSEFASIELLARWLKLYKNILSKWKQKYADQYIDDGEQG